MSWRTSGRLRDGFIVSIMSRKYKIRDQQKLYFVTFTVLDWMDVFIRDEYRTVVVESIKYCQANKGLEVYAYCIMTNHIHLILRSGDESKPLEGIIRDIKSFTSKNIRKILENPNQVRESRQWMLDRMYKAGKYNNNNIDFQFWQQHNHPIELDTNELMD